MTLTTTDEKDTLGESKAHPEDYKQQSSDFSSRPTVLGTKATHDKLSALTVVTSEMPAISSAPGSSIEQINAEAEPRSDQQIFVDEGGRRQLFYKITSRATTVSIALYATIVVVGLASLITGVGTVVDTRLGPDTTDPAAEALPPLPIDNKDQEVEPGNMASNGKTRPERPTSKQKTRPVVVEEEPASPAGKPAAAENGPSPDTETDGVVTDDQTTNDQTPASPQASTPSTQAPVVMPPETTTTSTSPERLSRAEARAARAQERQTRRQQRRRDRLNRQANDDREEDDDDDRDEDDD